LILVFSALAAHAEPTDAAQQAATALSLDVAYVTQMQAALDALYRRDYSATKADFTQLDATWGTTYHAPIGETLVWQALMLENFDFRYDKPYQASNKRVRAALTAAIKQPGWDAWEHVLMGCLVGIESMHAARGEQYLSSLQIGFEAMDHIQAAREAAPAFHDLVLADGIYNYWRTVLTESSRMLPDFGDHKAEGLAQMGEISQDGVFLTAPATLALTFSWIEENQLDNAIAAADKNKASYPDSVVNNLLLGRVDVLARKYDDALAAFDDVTRVDADNFRVKYYRGLAYLRTGKVDDAKVQFEAFLATDGLDDTDRSAGAYRLGECAEKQGDVATAETRYKESVAIDGYGPAKLRLQKLKEAAKAP
jgi:tetratricopeptide (TPR) repeat protein